MFYHVNCLPCLIFIWVSNTPIDNQLLTKTFCSPLGDRLSVRDAGKQKDCGPTRKPHPAHSGYQVMSPSSGKLSKLAEPLSATTIVIAGRHGQERISFRMLLPSEPLSRAMLSSSVCHAPPSMSSWVFACPHRQQPSQSHATSCGKSMTHHIACHVQRRLCSCSDSLVVCPADSSAESVASKRCRMF